MLKLNPHFTDITHTYFHGVSSAPSECDTEMIWQRASLDMGFWAGNCTPTQMFVLAVGRIRLKRQRGSSSFDRRGSLSTQTVVWNLCFLPPRRQMRIKNWNRFYCKSDMQRGCVTENNISLKREVGAGGGARTKEKQMLMFCRLLKARFKSSVTASSFCDTF